MRLLVLSSWLPSPPDNGSKMRAYHLIEWLSRRHALTLLTFGTPGDPAHVDPLRKLCARVEVVHPAPRGGAGRAVRGLLSSVPRHLVQTENRRMHSLVASLIDGHDVAVGLQLNSALYLLRLVDTVPTVLDEIEMGVFRDRCTGSRSAAARARHGLTWWKLRRFVRHLVDRCDCVTVVSGAERGHLQLAGCDMRRVTVVPNGIDVPPAVDAQPRQPRLIYPGSVTFSANLDAVRHFVREVLPIIRRSRPDLVFCVTGSTDGVDVRELARVEGVTFTGWLPDVRGLIAESAACVVPLRVGGGTRLKVLQAMALGAPVVSTSKGIEGLDLAPESDVLVGDTPDAFAAHVLRLVGDPVLGGRLADTARESVKRRYAWDSIAPRFEAVIDRARCEHPIRGTGRSLS